MDELVTCSSGLEATGGWSFWAELEGFSSFNPVAQEEFLVLGLNRVTL